MNMSQFYCVNVPVTIGGKVSPQGRRLNLWIINSPRVRVGYVTLNQLTIVFCFSDTCIHVFVHPIIPYIRTVFYGSQSTFLFMITFSIEYFSIKHFPIHDHLQCNSHQDCVR